MSTKNICTVIGAGDFELPQNRLVRVFENHHNVAIIDPAKEGTPDGGLGVVDSIHLRAYPGEEARRKAIIDLLKRNGAQPVVA